MDKAKTILPFGNKKKINKIYPDPGYIYFLIGATVVTLAHM